MAKRSVVLGIAYDFDGTLAPGNMQEHQFLPDVGINAGDFWREVKQITKREQADEVLVYMNLMLRKAHAAGISVRRADFKKRGNEMELFQGVEDWFDRINEYGKKKGVKVAHYLISSGNDEIFSGTSIASKFDKVYASKFLFDENGIAFWPALAVNYTAKTQYLFRINKNAHDIADSETINKVISKNDRYIPFENMIFIGDGATDIPCFRLVKEEGGLSIAVFKPHKKGGRGKADQYLDAGRVHCVAPANYTEGQQLDKIVKAQIELVAAKAIREALL
ncbi:HAD family hydrolase [uncultured Cohaesibacter sp.]|uniref:HAD family hydrolase n=1 Tax=uncultured Cohaesibacter sp. TaxID=1002546 RepID=UPI0029C8258B|nr:HAD family hydrolase [uncultured Cohaesibacter sp.]